MRSLTRRELLFASSAAALAAVGRGPMMEGLRWFGQTWEMARPNGIVVHHSATEPRLQAWMNAEAMDDDHRRRGFAAFYRGRLYHIAYHYVILPDGALETGRPEGCRGGHTRSLRHNYWTGICLVGWFDPCWRNPCFHRPTPEQMKTLVDLSADLVRRHRFPLSHILPHRDVSPTMCPGRSFPWDEYVTAVRGREIFRDGASDLSCASRSDFSRDVGSDFSRAGRSDFSRAGRSDFSRDGASDFSRDHSEKAANEFTAPQVVPAGRIATKVAPTPLALLGLGITGGAT